MSMFGNNNLFFEREALQKCGYKYSYNVITDDEIVVHIATGQIFKSIKSAYDHLISAHKFKQFDAIVTYKGQYLPNKEL